MANSQYEYVKSFETNDSLLPNTYLVVRIDGHAFHRFTTLHHFSKPNDLKGIHLMSHAAKQVMAAMEGTCVCAYGISDEFSFVFKRSYSSYNRRASKLVTTVVSLFTGAYILNWQTYFPGTVLQYAPSFDGRVVVYPTDKNLRDYLSWRQVDQHVNNLYNTTFWALQLLEPKCNEKEGGGGQKSRKEKLTAEQAELRLRGSFSPEKHDILYLEYGINYNSEPEIFKKGTVLVYETTSEGRKKKRGAVVEKYVDLIGEGFWREHSYILDDD